VKQLLDGDYYAMYSPAGVDNTQVSCMPCKRQPSGLVVTEIACLQPGLCFDARV
jgi:hypothetical protein